MKSSEERKSGLSESFVIGVVAMIFLILGYQTALFIHQSAVTKIAANRDAPDTVFVYARPAEADVRPLSQEKGDEVRMPVCDAGKTMARKNSAHSLKAETVRENVPRRKVETFRFDPNSVSVEDLCRLGFSPKQARSIESYRLKGGRFRRKSDFAKSYVVSDSVFRRLEPFIDIPLTDLNTADSAAFDALPGIGGWFASRMIEHREALGGYSYKEQLMDIYRFDQEKFDGLKDLVTVSPEYKTPYPLWALPADSLRLHPYIGNIETARSIVLYRETTSPDKWTVDGLREAGILSSTMAEKLSRCALGQ